MASIHISDVCETIRAKRNAHSVADYQTTVIHVGSRGTLFLSREESVQLEADLHAINTEATPVDAGVEA